MSDSRCPSCNQSVLDIDVRCPHCGKPLGTTGAHGMLGKVMLGQYELVDVLGQGGMSVVFKGKHHMTEQEVALKILPPELAAHSQVKSRFLDEAKALAALDHPNIVHLYNFGQEEGYFVLAMQFVAGRTWERMILERKRLPWQISCRIAVDVLRALEYAHGRGVIHRDMKPSNVLVRDHDGSATVMDFGIAKMTTSTRLTATGQTMGTVRYMSPEQVRGQEVDSRTDIYSLGATLFESLTGETPFDGNTHFEIMTKHLHEPAKRPSQFGIELPVAIDDAVVRCLAKKPDDRFSTARELRKLLENTLREADPGFTETQKVSKDEIAKIVTVRPKSAPAARVATASDLADQLEPPTQSMPSRRRRRWVVGFAMIVILGAIGTVLAIKQPWNTRWKTPYPHLKLSAPQRLDDVTVVTDGTIPPAQLADEFRREIKLAYQRYADEAKRRRLPVAAMPKLPKVYAIPQRELCEPRGYTTGGPPANCATALATFSVGDQSDEGINDRDRRVYLASDRLDVSIAVAATETLCLELTDIDLDLCTKRTPK